MSKTRSLMEEALRLYALECPVEVRAWDAWYNRKERKFSKRQVNIIVKKIMM